MSASPKTQPEPGSARAYLETLTPARRRHNGLTALDVFEAATGIPGELWTGNMVLFGRLHYRYASGHSGVTGRVGFAARAAELVLYGLQDFAGAPELLARLGPHRLSKACVYVRNIDDLDLDVLGELAARGFAHVGPDEVAG